MDDSLSSLKAIHNEIGIDSAHLSQNRLAFCEQPPLEELKVVDIDREGKPFILVKDAADLFIEMRLAAQYEGIQLNPYSGFRSYLYQKHLIRRKLLLGRPLEAILSETAIPGFSEHHTGRAVDICTEGIFDLSEAFEQTDAFKWLLENAHRYGFSLSYPRNNTTGIVFEPWHWFFNRG